MYGPGPGQGNEASSNFCTRGRGPRSRDGSPNVQIAIQILVVGEGELVVVEVVVVGARIFMKNSKASQTPSVLCWRLEATVGPYVRLFGCIVVAGCGELCVGANIRAFGKGKKLSGVVR